MDGPRPTFRAACTAVLLALGSATADVTVAIGARNNVMVARDGAWSKEPLSIGNIASGAADSRRQLLQLNIPNSLSDTPFQRFTNGVTTVSAIGKGRLLMGSASTNFAWVANQAGSPSLLLSNDRAVTFMKVTGLPSWTSTQGNPGPTTLTTISVSDLVYPAIHAPDITCFAATGSNTVVAVGGVVGLGAPQSFPGVEPSTAAILISNNGGTVWQNVPVMPTAAEIVAAYGRSAAEGAALYGRPFPGALLSVSATSNGKYLYAVGVPPCSVVVTSGAGSLSNIILTTTTLGFESAHYGTIMASADGGATWALQQPPALFSSTAVYTLMSVYTVSGSTAVAVGGGMDITSASSNGAIIATTNGGFTWQLASYPRNTGTAPIFNVVQFTPQTKVGWIGGYALPTDSYPTSFKAAANGAAAVSGVAYSVLYSANGGATWTSPPISSFPAGFVITSSTATPTSFRNVFGISWSTSQNGWMYGEADDNGSIGGFIMRTTNGGQNWVWETPNSVVAGGANAGPVYSIMPSF